MNRGTMAMIVMCALMLFSKFGVSGLAFLLVFGIPIALVFRWDKKMADQYPRWLGGMNPDFAPPSILDTDAQAIVAEAKQKINKIDEDHLAGASAEALPAAAGGSPALQNTGGIDTPGPPTKSRQGTEGGQGGNYCGVEQLEARLAHNQEVASSNLAPATSVPPDRCGYAHQPVESRPDFADQRYGHQAPARAGFETGFCRRST